MAEVLAGNRSAAVAVEELMLRPQKTEVALISSSIVHRRSDRLDDDRRDDGRWTMENSMDL